jgi:hypothetical protein
MLWKRTFQLLIGVEDEDSCGISETGETPQEPSDEEAHRPPAESEVFHGNQQRYYKPFFLINNYKKLKEKSSKR